MSLWVWVAVGLDCGWCALRDDNGANTLLQASHYGQGHGGY